MKQFFKVPRWLKFCKFNPDMEIHYHGPVNIYIMSDDQLIHKKLDKIMAQNDDLNLKIDGILSAQNEAAVSIEGIAGDITGIKDDLANGLSAEQTQAAVNRLGTVAEKMTTIAASLKNLDDQTPAKTTTPPVEGGGGTEGGGTGDGNGDTGTPQ